MARPSREAQVLSFGAHKADTGSLSIFNYDGSNPSIDSIYFPVTQSSIYWTSDPFQPNPGGAWFVYFYGGYTYANYKTNTNYVRLVRSG